MVPARFESSPKISTRTKIRSKTASGREVEYTEIGDTVSIVIYKLNVESGFFPGETLVKTSTALKPGVSTKGGGTG
jgi:hypothetical protein